RRSAARRRARDAARARCEGRSARLRDLHRRAQRRWHARDGARARAAAARIAAAHHVSAGAARALGPLTTAIAGATLARPEDRLIGSRPSRRAVSFFSVTRASCRIIPLLHV